MCSRIASGSSTPAGIRTRPLTTLSRGSRKPAGASRPSSGGEALLPVILDGENAWEHFEANGHPFLRALYGRLATHPELRTVTMAEACATPGAAPGTIESIFPGSWIDSNFSIWIGHRDDQMAWSQLGDAREALERASGAPATAVEQAREELLIAEGSDWFWWYGDDHSSDHDAEFDDLFRRHLRNVYRLLQQPVPEELFVSNISAALTIQEEQPPSAWLSPTIDGEATSYFEWLGAGTFEIPVHQGAMHQTGAVPRILTRVLFGFSASHLFVRLDGERRLADLMAEGHGFSLTFLHPSRQRLEVEPSGRATWSGTSGPRRPGRGRHRAGGGGPAGGPRGGGRRIGGLLRVGQPARRSRYAGGGTLSGAAADSG